MSRGSVSVAVYAVAFLHLLVAGTGRAQSRASRRHEPVALRLEVTEPSTHVVVETADKKLGPMGRLVLQCKTLCETEVPRGTYRLTLTRDGETSALDSELVSLHRPMQFTAEPVSTGLRVLGGALLITGGAAVVGGVVAVSPMVLGSMCHGGDTCNRHITLARVGFIAAGSGGVLVLVGLLLYLHNRSSFDGARLRAGERGLTMELLPGPSGITGVATGRF
jgi:hypothetical protein